jgi:WD40 repeat protein/serine/threonine protein kinase
LYVLPVAERDLSGRTLGTFVLRERIGTGGYGAVYRGEQLPFGRPCVVKVLKDERLHDGGRLRFLREAQLASRLDHPYAAHVYASGTECSVEDDDRVVWIAMELIRGITLDDWVKKHGPMSLERFVPFFECIAEVVQTAHDLGIVHRDLKPENIMVIERAGRIYPKLLDFGIAKLAAEVQAEIWPEGSPAENVDKAWTPPTVPIRPNPRKRTTTYHGPVPGGNPRLTTAGSRMGSLPYMSPEQWRDAVDVGPAADLYALGVVAYEVLTGRRPFQAETAQEYATLHQHVPIPPMGSPDLDSILVRALAKTPQARQSSVLELAAEFRAALGAIEREHIRSSAQKWTDRGRPSRLLWGAGMLADFERTRTRNVGVLTDLEYEFVESSQRRARRSAWLRGVALAAVGAVAALQYRASKNAQLAEEQARSARQVAEVTRTQAELIVTQSLLEQGRSALLHGEPEALPHLAEAYKRGDHSPSTKFMLARAMQPWLAEQARLTSSAGRTWSATFSPDGRRVVTTDDKGAQVWDAANYRLLFTLAHGDIVYQAVYANDGTSIVTAGGDNTVRIWEAATGALVRELKYDGKRLRYGAVAADGNRVAAIDLDGAVVHVWSAATGVPLAELRTDASGFFSLAFSADGRWLATSGGNDVNVFDTRTWVQVRIIPGPSIHSLSWDPSGPRLLTGSFNGDASIWTIPSGARTHHLRELGEPIDAVAFSPNGEFVVAASRGGAETVWSAASGMLQSQGNYLHGKLISIEFDPTSKLVVAAGASGRVAVADAELGMPVAVLEGSQNVVWVAHFDPSTKRVIGASSDGARVWNAVAPYHRWSSPPISDDCGLVTSLEPDRRVVAIGCRNHSTQVWDTVRGQLLAELPSVTKVDGDFPYVYPAVSPAGDRAAIARSNAVEVYELPGGRLLRTIAHGAAVNTVAFASAGRDLVSGAIDGSLLVTRDNGAQLALPTFSSAIDAAGFLPDGRIVAADAQERLRVYDPSGIVLAELKTSARVRMLRMSLDSRRLIMVPSFMGKAASPELWDLEHYRPLTQLESEGQAYSARFVAGGQILTASSDGAARRWDGVTGRLLQTYRGSSRALADATLTPDGLMVVAGGSDGLLRFWDITSGRPLWAMQAHRSHLIGIRIEGDDVVTRGLSGDISRWSLPEPEQVFKECSGHGRGALSPCQSSMVSIGK